MAGSCLTPSVIYQAEVTRLDDGSKEKYVGLTKDPIKMRITQHNSDFRNPKSKTKTSLSKHIWNLKKSGLDYQVSWNIIAKAKSYSPASKGCNLCTTEIFYILYKPHLATLNQKMNSGLPAGIEQDSNSQITDKKRKSNYEYFNYENLPLL